MSQNGRRIATELSALRGAAVDLRQLRHFLGVARLGIIAEAARQMHIAQPALSRQMSNLESDLGVRLFNRRARGVTLTSAGEELRARAEQLLESAAELRERVVDASQGKSGLLRLGVLPGYGWLPTMGEAIIAMQEQAPGVRFSVEPGVAALQLDAIKAGNLDAGVVPWRSQLDPALTGIPAFIDSVVFAVPDSFGIPSDGPLRLEHMAQRPFLTFPRERSPAYYDALSRAFASARFKPAERAVLAFDMPTLLDIVSAGLGWAAVPKSFERRCPAGVRFHSIEGMEVPIAFELVWRTDDKSVLLADFVRQWTRSERPTRARPEARKRTQRS